MTTALAVAVLGLAIGACSRAEPPPPAPAPPPSPPPSAPATERIALSAADEHAFATMKLRVNDYSELQATLARSLPKLPTNATPAELDQNQRAFETLVRKARARAKPGDIFTPEARPVIKRLLAGIFGGPDGQALKASIRDENPVDPVVLKLQVNSRYPDELPLSTVPPQVLQLLPRLTADLEYRFIGDWLILLDTHAHVIVDFIDNALPK